eukprot:380328-Rhodomonas_salina.1
MAAFEVLGQTGLPFVTSSASGAETAPGGCHPRRDDPRKRRRRRGRGRAVVSCCPGWTQRGSSVQRSRRAAARAGLSLSLARTCSLAFLDRCLSFFCLSCFSFPLSPHFFPGSSPDLH